jgi:membrane protein
MATGQILANAWRWTAHWGQLIYRAGSQFMDDDCTTMAAALAYYATFSLAPLLLIVISIVGTIFGHQVVQQEVQEQIQGLIGEGAATQVGAMVQSASQHSSTGVFAAILGVLTLLIASTGAFAQLQSSLNRVWQVKPNPAIGGIRNFLGHRLLSLGMILAVGFLLIVSLAVSAALSAFGDFLAGYLPPGFSGSLLEAISLGASLVIIAAMFAAIFKVLPDAKIRWHDVRAGAILTAVLFTLGKYGIGVYLGHSGTASAYGAAGSFVLIVLWVYYSSLIFLFGAEFTFVWAEAHRGFVDPKPGAVRVTVEEKVHPNRAA